MKLRGVGILCSANDFLLNIEIARACSANKTYLALARRAIATFPDDPIVQLYHARVLLTRSRQTEGIEFLLSCESTLGRTHRALWGAELANMYASAGFGASCRRCLDAVCDEPGIDSPLALYTKACAHEGLRQWDEAIEFAERCVAAAPDWTRARAYLANCLLARGRIEPAEHELSEAARRGHEEAMIDVTTAMLSMSLGHFDEARPRLEAILRDWPHADYARWIRRTLFILLVEQGERDAARQVADGREELLGLPLIPDRSSGRHCFIPLPLIAQNRNQCVPTSIAMAVYPQGRTFDPNEMFREMDGGEGTSLWRMRQWCDANGFRVVPIRLKREAIIAMLDVDIPLIGTIEGPFNSHVDVICGFNDDLETLYVRDPSHWAPIALPWEIAMERYRIHAGLMAVIAADRSEVLAAAEAWRSDECAMLLDLSQAVALGDVCAAEASYGRIADDSPAAFLRDCYGVNVVISPIRFGEQMRKIADNDSANVIARFRALLALCSDDLDGALAKLLESDASNRFGPESNRYLRLLQLMNIGDWTAAGCMVDRLLVCGCGIARFWELKSDILAELGRHEASSVALDRAIELEPLRMSTREKKLKRATVRLTLAEYLAEFNELLAHDPHDKGLLLGLAAALKEGPDGRAFEQAAREAIRWFPRLPMAYSNLLNWYRVQGREDLHDRLLLQARAMLPDEFANIDKPSSPELASAENADLGADRPLPEGHGELLKLVWQIGDPRREAALARAIELQQAGQFHWYQVARLVACRLLVPDQAGAELSDPETVLPQTPPGAPHWFAELLCDMLADDQLSIRTLLAIDRWMLRVVPNLSDYSELWFKRVLLLEQAQQMERALEELRRLLDRYPAMSSALYRMGVVKFRQQDYSAARGYFQKALDVNPGLFGAMCMLRDVHETLGDAKLVLCSTRMLRLKLPFSVSYLRDEVLAAARLESAAAAEELLNRAAEDFPRRRIAVLRAILYLESNQWDEAAELLSNADLSPDDDDDSFEEWLQARMFLAQARKKIAEILSLCNEGLRRWPHSTRLKELKAEELAAFDLPQSQALLRDVLCHGEPRVETALQYLRITAGPSDQEARDVILAAPEAGRQKLAELFSDATSHSDFLRFNEPFLNWARDTFPESNELLYKLLLHYDANKNVLEAVSLAEDLYRRLPNHPEAARILGRSLMDHEPKQALRFLEEACEQNRSVDFLFDLARCCHIVSDVDRSQELHWEVLTQNPYHSGSWTNLYILGASRQRLWPFLCPMLDRGSGLNDEYFHVAAVKTAIELGRKLPTSWFPRAIERWTILQTYPGFADERQRLRRALLAWQSQRPHDVQVSMNPPRDFIESVIARYFWPRCGWIASD